MVQYLRQTVDVENAVIVSPDAGGAKRFVVRHLYSPSITLSLSDNWHSLQSIITCCQTQSRIRPFPQRAEKGQRSFKNGSRWQRDWQNCHSRR